MWKILAMEAELLQIQTLKTSSIGGICSLGNFCTHLIFMIGDKMKGSNTNTNTVSLGHCYISAILATEMQNKLCLSPVF